MSPGVLFSFSVRKCRKFVALQKSTWIPRRLAGIAGITFLQTDKDLSRFYFSPSWRFFALFSSFPIVGMVVAIVALLRFLSGSSPLIHTASELPLPLKGTLTARNFFKQTCHQFLECSLKREHRASLDAPNQRSQKRVRTRIRNERQFFADCS